MITVIGYPRSGTHLLREMLRKATGLDVFHSHAIPDSFDEENGYVFTIRDPRDAFASHYLLYLHDRPGSQRTQIEHLELFFKGKEMTQPHLHLGWARYMDEWRRALGRSRLKVCGRHEWIMRSAKSAKLQITHIIYGLGLVPDGGCIDRAISLTEGVRCDPSTILPEDMGRIGKWKDTLEEDTVYALWDYCGDLAQKLGYRWEEIERG